MFVHTTAWLLDCWTVTQKEMRERLNATLTDRTALAVVLALQLVGGIIVPMLTGSGSFGQTLLLILTILLPVPLVTHSAADSFAGERERHTLETLLASRLPTQAILVGKVLAASLYGWISAVVLLLLGIGVMSARELQLVQIFATPTLILLSLALSLLVALFTACTGAYNSLHTGSVYQARLASGLLLALMLFVTALLSTALLQLMPGHALQEIESDRLAVALAGLGAGMLVADLGLYIATSLRFKRRLLIVE